MKAILCSVVILFSLSAYGDILQVDVRATFVGDLCGDCVEQINIGLQYDTLRPQINDPHGLVGEMIPGTLTAQSTGFLGTFLTTGANVRDDLLLVLASNQGDQLDIGMPSQPGEYDLQDFRIFLWGCFSEACRSGYDPLPFFISPTEAHMSVRSVPEPSPLVLLGVLGAFILGVPSVLSSVRRRLKCN
jgi:hypothetical protein